MVSEGEEVPEFTLHSDNGKEIARAYVLAEYYLRHGLLVEFEPEISVG